MADDSIKQTYKPERRDNINTLMISKLTQIIEINQREDVMLHNKDNQNAICQELIQLCQKDKTNLLSVNEENRRQFLIQELFKLGKVYDIKYKQFEQQTTQIINLIKEIKKIRFKNRNTNEIVNFDNELDKELEASKHENFEVYIRNLNIIKLALQELVKKVDSFTEEFDKNNKDYLKNFFLELNKKLPATGNIEPNDIVTIVDQYIKNKLK